MVTDTAVLAGDGVLAGRYVIDREIGRSGLGPVWLGVDTVLDRAVELKQVGRVAPESAPDVVRAEREAHLTARVHHEHVVSVFDLVEDDGHLWLVTEHVEGPTLAALIEERGTLAPDDLAPVLEQVADALAAAHEHGVVHRGVGPASILIAPDGSAKLADFGSATDVTTDAAPHDVWSLGRAAFEALSGHLPEDVGPTTRLDGSDPLTPIVEAMIRDDPKARPSMADVHRAASHLTPDDDSPAGWRPARIGTDWRRIGAAAVAAALVAAVVALGTIFGGGAPLRGAAAPTDAVLEGFVTDYLTAAGNDPAAGFDMLTAAYQRSSGGLVGYESSWSGVSNLNVETVQGDAADMTVSYTYSYDRGGVRRTADVTLRLRQAGTGFLVAGTA